MISAPAAVATLGSPLDRVALADGSLCAGGLVLELDLLGVRAHFDDEDGVLLRWMRAFRWL